MAFFKLTANKIKLSESELLADCIVSVYSAKGVHLEGHKGVLVFSEEEIVFKRKKGAITILGKNLNISEISSTDAYVSGEIESVIMGRKNG